MLLHEQCYADALRGRSEWKPANVGQLPADTRALIDALRKALQRANGGRKPKIQDAVAYALYLAEDNLREEITRLTIKSISSHTMEEE